jgi:hypothetical protein
MYLNRYAFGVWTECLFEEVIPAGVKLDHTESMVLPLPVDVGYRESILGFASKNVLAGERIALVSPTLEST